jgi:hypothetical protein
MPLLYVDLIEGRAPAEIRTLLDAIHDAVVEAFVSITDNVGYGRAQFLTGELK